MALLKQQWQSENEFIRPKYQVRMTDFGEVHEVSITTVVHTIKMGDVEDPDLWVGQYIHEWQQTEDGKWIMENSAPTPSWTRHMDYSTYGYQYQIRAYLTHKQLTFWKLKFE